LDSRARVRAPALPARRDAAVVAVPVVVVRAAVVPVPVAVVLVAAVPEVVRVAVVRAAAVPVVVAVAIAAVPEVRVPKVARPFMRVVRSVTPRAGQSAEPRQ